MAGGQINNGVAKIELAPVVADGEWGPSLKIRRNHAWYIKDQYGRRYNYRFQC